jgi:hypothetical protein
LAWDSLLFGSEIYSLVLTLSYRPAEKIADAAVSRSSVTRP